MEHDLIKNISSIHTTKLGVERICRNAVLTDDDVVAWARGKIRKANMSQITRKGKNWYVSVDGIRITINAHSFTIITAHKEKEQLSK